MNGYFLPRHPEKNGPAHFTFLHSPGLLCRTSAQTGLRARTAIKERQVCRDCDKSGKESVHVIRRNSRRHRLHGCQREGQLSFLAGAFAGGNPLYGIYPAGSAVSSAEEEVAVSVPSAQTAVNVTLAQAAAYCGWLTAQDGRRGKGRLAGLCQCRLPGGEDGRQLNDVFFRACGNFFPQARNFISVPTEILPRYNGQNGGDGNEPNRAIER